MRDEAVADHAALGKADPEAGIDVSELADTYSTGPIQHVDALNNLIQTAQAAAKKDYPKNSTTRRGLEKLARDATEDRDKLVAYLQEAVSNYPNASASVLLQDKQLLEPVGRGMTSAPRELRYDFDNDVVRSVGRETAVFKRSQTEVEADGGLSNTGVAINTTSGCVCLSRSR